MYPYDYDPEIRGLTEVPVKKNRSVRHYRIAFEGALDTGFWENSRVIGDYYLPTGGKDQPLAILVHGMGDYSVWPCKLIARGLLKQGIACFILYLSVHSRRMPGQWQTRMLHLTGDEWFDLYRFSVVDIRQVLDWASTKQEIDLSKIMVVGISFGGFVSSITMGLEPRIKAGAFIVSGGNSVKISRLSRNGRYQKNFQISREELDGREQKYFEYLEQVAAKGLENVIAAEQSYLTDPMTFAGRLAGRSVRMINALHDKYVPREAVEDFWHACGKPPIKWISSGHTGIWFRFGGIMNFVNGLAAEADFTPVGRGSLGQASTK